MTDRREMILERLLAILDAIPGSNAAFRNKTDIAEGTRPCIVLIDGDEDAEGRDSNRAGRAPRRVHMHPQIYILAGGQAEDIGTTLNEMRAAAIYELTHDVTLQALTVNADDVVYEGAQSLIEDGRRVEGVIVLSFSITYLLRPGDLAVSG